MLVIFHKPFHITVYTNYYCVFIHIYHTLFLHIDKAKAIGEGLWGRFSVHSQTGNVTFSTHGL